MADVLPFRRAPQVEAFFDSDKVWSGEQTSPTYRTFPAKTDDPPAAADPPQQD